MKKEYKILLVTGIIPFAVNIILPPFLPREIPMHYNSLGEVDRIGSKFEVLILTIYSYYVYKTRDASKEERK